MARSSMLRSFIGDRNLSTRRFVLTGALLAFSAVLIAPESNARASIYNIINYPSIQNPYSISGTITTANTVPDNDGNVGATGGVTSVMVNIPGITPGLISMHYSFDDALRTECICGVSYLVIPPDTSNPPGWYANQVSLWSANNVSASLYYLQIVYSNPYPGYASGTYYAYYQATSSSPDVYLWNYTVYPYPNYDTNPPPNDTGYDPTTMVLAEGPSCIPEPATLIIWSLLGGLGITIGRRCRRKPA